MKKNKKEKQNINWNWARFEWMMEHPEFDKSTADSIGLWTCGDKVVGAAIYDMYFGEAFCGVLPEYAGLYPRVLDYAFRSLRDENGLGVAICDGSRHEIEAALQAGFAPAEQTETIMAISLDKAFTPALPADLRFVSPDPIRDAEALQWLFWQGFDHGEDRAAFEKQPQAAPQIRRHCNPDLGVAAAAPTGEFVSFCCLWYMAGTDYAYVEPVCTIPSFRGRGAARAVIGEALNRARALGAKKAYVISDMAFYERLGFQKEYRYSFYWKR